ncbi:MAG TPA: HD domain-containing phosphohydrolase [Pyrinomonadaceae bacterium]|nr:HD domain-containing phosphohydrolase [Pyrinomonadaceae bacterium]
MELPTQKLVHTFGALADLGQEITDSHDVSEMVLTSLRLLLGALAIRRGAIFEHAPEEGLLRLVASRGFESEFAPALSLSDEAVKALLGVGPESISPAQLLTDRPQLGELLDQFKVAATASEVQLAVPMSVRGELVGVVLLGSKATDEPFAAEECEIIFSMARHIGVGIHTHRLLQQIEQRAEENRRLYEDLRAIYRDTVRAFAAAIDIKDKYTQGHSERVGKYSEIIARELGWSEDEVEGIAIAGYLHDIGKLVVERDIINAPYKIDAKASSELNRHPAAGYEILSPIHHPYTDIPLMAKYHHERLDGRGYPDGLTGDQIPLGAKIVSLADSFDAMTTDRPYKRRRSLEDVIVDFRANTGKQFSADVVVAFLRALLKEITGETKERRILKMLGKNYVEPELVIPLLKELISELDSAASTVAATTG